MLSLCQLRKVRIEPASCGGAMPTLQNGPYAYAPRMRTVRVVATAATGSVSRMQGKFARS